MPASVNAGARLDRPPIAPFHYRTAVQSHFSTLAENGWFRRRSAR